jgi:hypothetical protein
MPEASPEAVGGLSAERLRRVAYVLWAERDRADTRIEAYPYPPDRPIPAGREFGSATLATIAATIGDADQRSDVEALALHARTMNRRITLDIDNLHLHESSTVDHYAEIVQPERHAPQTRAEIEEAIAADRLAEIGITNVSIAKTDEAHRSTGEIVHVSSTGVYQDVGRGAVVRHEIAAMEAVPIVGTVARVIYHEGRAQVADLTHGQDREQGVDRDG